MAESSWAVGGTRVNVDAVGRVRTAAAQPAPELAVGGRDDGREVLEVVRSLARSIGVVSNPIVTEVDGLAAAFDPSGEIAIGPLERAVVVVVVRCQVMRRHASPFVEWIIGHQSRRRGSRGRGHIILDLARRSRHAPESHVVDLTNEAVPTAWALGPMKVYPVPIWLKLWT